MKYKYREPNRRRKREKFKGKKETRKCHKREEGRKEGKVFVFV